MVRTWIILLFSPALVFAGQETLDTHDPNITATIVIHGFNPDGADHDGVFGEDDLDQELLWQVANYAGLPVNDGSAILPANVIATTVYYGSIPPSYYTSQDIAELNAVSKQYGGGIPRYALIIAKYARHIMERSGADQVNIVSASMGSFVARWMIEKDSGGLSGDGDIARWLSLEGVLCGNWAASNELISDIWDQLGTPSIDVDQMHYNWVEANLHSPRLEADSALYGDILIGMEMSTRDTTGDGTLTDIMLLKGDFHANDGVVTIDDGHFHSMSSQSKFYNLPTTSSWLHVNHYELRDYLPAMVQIANFLTQRRRVVATITRLQVTNTEEPGDFWWDWMPAEIVIQSDVFSPLVEAEWGITESICTRGVEGASSPIYEFNADGEQQTLSHIVFDDFVSADETSLDIEIGLFELDWSEKYEVFEPLDGDGNDLGTTSITIEINGAGTTSMEFSTANFNGTVEIQVVDYPFATLDETISGDVNGDGSVNVTDVLALISAWGPCTGCPEDIDGSGLVDVTDLLVVISNWT
jgi:hypothetical protein